MRIFHYKPSIGIPPFQEYVYNLYPSFFRPTLSTQVNSPRLWFHCYLAPQLPSTNPSPERIPPRFPVRDPTLQFSNQTAERGKSSLANLRHMFGVFHEHQRQIWHIVGAEHHRKSTHLLPSYAICHQAASQIHAEDRPKVSALVPWRWIIPKNLTRWGPQVCLLV